MEIHGATLKENVWQNYRRLKVCLWYLQSLGTDGVPKAPVYLVRSKTVPKLDQTKCQPLTSLYPEVILYVEQQNSLKQRRADGLLALPVPLLSLLTDLPVLKEDNDKETETLLRYWGRAEGTKVNRSMPAPEYTRSLYDLGPSKPFPDPSPRPRNLEGMVKRTQDKYKDILRFHSEFKGYRGNDSDFRVGIEHLVKVITDKLSNQ